MIPPALRVGSRHYGAFLQFSASWKGENLFSTAEYHWVYQLHSRAGPMTSSRWSTQNEPGDFWEMFLSQNVLCGHVFNLTEVLCMYGGF